MEATFSVTVKLGGREPQTYTVEAPERGDGFEGAARTRAMMAWFRDNDGKGQAPLKGDLVEYEVRKIA